jgi:hypothetical protein
MFVDRLIRSWRFEMDELKNDTQVFYVLDGGPWRGTRAAIRAKGLDVDTNIGSQAFCPHQWLKDGFVDPELASKYPLTIRTAP